MIRLDSYNISASSRSSRCAGSTRSLEKKEKGGEGKSARALRSFLNKEGRSMRGPSLFVSTLISRRLHWKGGKRKESAQSSGSLLPLLAALLDDARRKRKGMGEAVFDFDHSLPTLLWQNTAESKKRKKRGERVVLAIAASR